MQLLLAQHPRAVSMWGAAEKAASREVLPGGARRWEQGGGIDVV